MNSTLFIVVLTLLLALVFFWSCRNLPKERWQMLAAVPIRRLSGGQWQALNLTFYGFFISGSIAVSLIVLCILLGAAEISVKGGIAAALLILGICIPSARIIAYWVEGKRHTFTVGGASFLGIVLAPWAILFINQMPIIEGYFRLPVVPVLAAMSISYCLGEGLGRLACISFGCCYGKALKDCHPITRGIFNKISFIFDGPTKKTVYAGKLAEEPLLPVQAITSVILMATSVLGCTFFLEGEYRMALLISSSASQIWRIYSETLRADFRGPGQFTTYQRLTLPAIFYIFCASYFFDSGFILIPDLARGLEVVWHPGIILTIQLVWLVSFLYFGCSTVTCATISFLLKNEHV